jgi:tRNA modification GTPase
VLRPTDDTICALSTPPGRGALAVIRVTGAEALAVVDRIAILLSGRALRDTPAGRVRRAGIVDADGRAIDSVSLTVFRAPASYTGDDLVEISCHGGPVVVRRILERLLRSGARTAGPGEFTQRAFLNGKMDLAEAEAVADLIDAETVEAARLAAGQQSGSLSRAVHVLRDDILGVLARIEASIDFPEDVGELDTEACDRSIASAIDAVDRLLATADAGILFREGVSVVLAGRPNAGKSSVMNALLRHARAIVTPIPGTTRDTLEESANIGGVPIRLTDTAGVRDTDDPIEREGVARTRSSIVAAGVVLIVVDSTAGWGGPEDEIAQLAPPARTRRVWNKADLAVPAGLGEGDIAVSAVTGLGLGSLEAAVLEAAGASAGANAEPAVITHGRHRAALSLATERLVQARATIAQNLPADFISIDVRGALSALGEITGETATDDIINEIFSRFCIGK